MTERFLLGVGVLLIPLFSIMTIQTINDNSLNNWNIIIYLLPWGMSILALYFGINGEIHSSKSVKERKN